jgi:ribosomal protein L11 methyltransferase
MKKFIKIEIESASPEDSEILIADLSENNFYAFEQDENLLTSYIKKEDFNEEKLKHLLQNIPYTSSEIEDRNWNEAWESQLQPIMIDDFVGIRASFHKPIKNMKHEIIITPKMSFGTGHHATTFLMVKQMEKINFRNKEVIDFGTGTGILAILAEKLGASSVLAIDNDEWSTNNSLENIEANNCRRIQVENTDTISNVLSVNIILVNINFNVLSDNVKNFSRLLHVGSLLVTSGFMLKDEQAVVAMFVKNNFKIKEREYKDDWVSIIFEKC